MFGFGLLLWSLVTASWELKAECSPRLSLSLALSLFLSPSFRCFLYWSWANNTCVDALAASSVWNELARHTFAPQLLSQVRYCSMTMLQIASALCPDLLTVYTFDTDWLTEFRRLTMTTEAECHSGRTLTWLLLYLLWEPSRSLSGDSLSKTAELLSRMNILLRELSPQIDVYDGRQLYRYNCQNGRDDGRTII